MSTSLTKVQLFLETLKSANLPREELNNLHRMAIAAIESVMETGRAYGYEEGFRDGREEGCQNGCDVGCEEGCDKG